MKKTKKLFLSLALVIGFATLAPAVSSFKNIANAEPVPVAYYIQVDKFVKNAIVGATYEIAPAKALEVGSTTEVGTVEVSAKTPYGQSVTINDNEFVVDYFGTYSVEYKYGDTVETLKFNASEGTYAFEFKENAKIVPASMPGNKNLKVIVENPTVLDEDGEEVSITGASVQVLVKDSEGLTVSLTDEESGLKSFTPNKEGVWRVRYNFVSSQGKVLLTEEKQINVDNNIETEYELGVSYTTPVQTADTKTEVKLPAVTVTNKKTNNQISNFILEVKAEKITVVNGNDTAFVDVTASTIEGRVFTPQEDGDYRITYTVKDFYDTNTWTGTVAYIRDVKDRKAPVVKVVEAYDAENLVDFVSAEHKIPSRAKSSHFVLPAIWAEDNVDQTLEGLKLTRKIRRNGVDVFATTENPSKELVFNPQATLGANQVEETLDGTNQWPTSGTQAYTIIYVAEDKAGNESETVYYTVEIDNDFQEGTAPEVKWADNIKSQIRLGEKLTFNAPISTHETHLRLKTIVEYAYADEATDSSAVTGWEVLDLEEGVYSLTLPETVASTVKTLRLRTKAYSYDAESDFAYKTVRIFETQDNLPVEIKEVDTTSVNSLNTYREGNDITLGKFVFEDDLIDFVSTEIVAVAENGHRVSVVNAKRTVNKADGTLTIENAKFFASFDGTYTVTIRATDINDNSATYSYTIEIAPYEAQIEPHFASPKTIYDGIVELGTTIEIPEAKIISSLTTEVPYSVNVTNGPANYRINNYEFEALEEGIYTIEYSAEVNGETITATFTVEVKDTKTPEIAGWAEVKNTIEDHSNPTIPAGGIVFRIPAVAVTDNSTVDMKNSKVEVKRGNTIITTINLEDLTPTLERAELKLNNNALYTITYTIKDTALAPNTRTYTATITVGDNILPKVELKDSKERLTAETAKINSTLDLNLSKIKFYDPGNGDLAVEDLEVTLRVNGESVKNTHEVDGETPTIFGYLLETAGTYTLTIRVKDEVGNWSEYYTENFTVTENANDGVETTEVIGIVLIVISALILAGSVIYFIISKRKVDEYKAK